MVLATSTLIIYGLDGNEEEVQRICDGASLVFLEYECRVNHPSFIPSSNLINITMNLR
jgi:hypothetical protein